MTSPLTGRRLFRPPLTTCAIEMLKARELACLRSERVVFAGLDLQLGEGQACFVAGPNGSGKSSLIRVLAGLLQPAAGEVAWNGESVRDEAFRADMHFLGHLDAVKPALTVEENLAFWAKLRGPRPIGEALDVFSLGPLRRLPGRVLSAGQKRRVALARLLVAPAALWLLDEPTVSLDAGSVAALEALIARHRGAGGIVVLSSNVAVALPDAVSLDMAAYRPDAPLPSC